MKFLLPGLLTLLHFVAASQVALPDNFKIGNSVEVFSQDSIKIFFNCGGAVADKNCAEYYRVGKMDTEIINVVGNFSDYYTNDKLYLRGTMHNNALEGPAQYYYDNGQVKEEGAYKNNLRQGKWMFYYATGQIEKVYDYTDGMPVILEAYAPDGKPTVINGNGAIKIQFSLYKQCNKFEIWGQLQNGKKNGEWAFANPNAHPITTEVFEEGNFINGKANNYVYTEKPKIEFTDFYASENLDLVEGNPGCWKNHFSPLTYKNELFQAPFFEELQQKLTSYNQPVKNQWLVVGISINNKNKVAGINVASSINDTVLEKHIHDLFTTMKGWQSASVNSKKIASDIYFSVLVDNNQVIIPADYLYKN